MFNAAIATSMHLNCKTEWNLEGTGATRPLDMQMMIGVKAAVSWTQAEYQSSSPTAGVALENAPPTRDHQPLEETYMLLRRITEHVKTQNWFAVGIDFLIVVVGVFVGLQVSNWNNALGDRADEQRYLVELEQDLVTAIAEIDETVGNAKMRQEAGAFVFNSAEQLETSATFQKMGETFSIEDRGDADPSNHLPLIFSIARIMDRHGDAYSELIATGKVSVIQDRSLVRALSSYYSRYDEIQTGDQMNWNQMFAIQSLFQSRGLPMTKPMSADDFLILIKEDDELEAAARNVSGLAGWQLNRLANLRDETDAVLVLVRDAQE